MIIREKEFIHGWITLHVYIFDILFLSPYMFV